MFRRESDKKTFTALDIRRYIDGLMSPAERNELERAALSDPLLEDALEGYASQSPDKTREDLLDLRSRLAHRVRPEERNRSGIWVRAAAVLVILAGAAILLYIHNRPSDIRPSLALESRKKAQPSPTQPAAPAPAAPAPPLVPAPSSPGASAPSAKVAPTPRIPPVPSARVAPALIPAPAQPGAPTPRGVPAPPAALEGKVADPFNRPIPGAVVRILPWGTETITDKNGHFNIGSGVVDSNATVSIEAVGYVTKTYPLSRLGQAPAIQLKTNVNSLNDVVVTGYGTNKKSFMARPDSAATNNHKDTTAIDTTEAQPIDGWTAFYQYVSDNKRNNIHGEVILSFRVNRKGKPADIVVEKSLCASCDSEARRLLQKGPRWTKKEKGRVRITF